MFLHSRQVFKHVHKFKWISLTKITWQIPQRANRAGCSGFRKCKRIPQKLVDSTNLCWFCFQFAESVNSLRISLTIFWLHLQLRIPRQLQSTERIYYHLFIDSTNCSGIRKFCCWFREVACFWSIFEHYSVLVICPWNPKQQRTSKKSNNVADSQTNLILACFGICLPFTKCTVWPRNV